MINKVISKLEQSRWNIGLAHLSAKEVVENPRLLSKNTKWLKHNYKNRFFADPFFGKVTEKTVEIMVEEYLWSSKKGRLAVLIVDKESCTLIERKELLEIDSHLSYPIDFQYQGNRYMYPENGAQQHLPLYKLENQSVVYERDLISLQELAKIGNETWLADATMVEHNGAFYIFATPDASNRRLAIFKSDTPLKSFKYLRDIKLHNDIENSRPAGNFFEVSGKLYRPTQNCTKSYGYSINIQRIDHLSDSELLEQTIAQITPFSRTYNRGVHTINFENKLCVIDGRGYRYPIARILLPFLYRLKNIGTKIKKNLLTFS